MATSVGNPKLKPGGVVDAAFLAGLHFVVILVIPARLVIARIPLSVTPAVVVAAALGVLWLCAHMVSNLGMAKGRSLVRSALVVLLCSFLASYGVGTRWALPSEELNLADSGMIRILACVGMGLFLCDALRRREQIDRLLRVVVWGTAVCALVGLLQFASIDAVPYLSFPGLRQVSENSYVLGRSSFRRPAGTTNHPIEFGLVCAIAVPLAIYCLMQARAQGRRSGRWVALLFLIASAALISLSRTAIIGLLVITLIMVVVLPKRSKMFVLGGAGGLLLAGGVLVPGLLGTLFNLFSNIEDDSSITTRTEDYTKAFAQVDLHPVLGRGFGTYLPYKYQLLDNQYLLSMIETGYLGLCVVIGVCLAGCYAAIRARMLSSDPEMRLLCACLLSVVLVIAIGMATFDLLSFGVATGLLFGGVGICGAALRIVRDDHVPGSDLRTGDLAEAGVVRRGSR